MRKTLLMILMIGLLLNTPVMGASPDGNANLQQLVQSVRVPPGFEITIFANNVPNARSLEWTPNGTLFVGTRNAGNVYALRDDDFNGEADGLVVIAQGLNAPNGVVFREGSLYVAEVNRVLRYDNIEANLTNPPQPVVVNAGFPSEGHHGWKFIRFGPDDKLYVPVGVPCNACQTQDARYGTIMRMNPDGSDLEVYAQGIRNTVGFDWDPLTDELWFTDNGRDDLGDDVPPDELNHAPEAGMHFGFPYCFGSSSSDPEFGGLVNCADYTPTAANLGPHVAALGMRFYTGTQFPDEYVNQILIAEHGSASRSEAIGYRVMLVRLDENRNVVAYEPFADGWLQNGRAWGRPVDIEQLPDGSILVSDDLANVIYRIRYTLPKPTATP